MTVFYTPVLSAFGQNIVAAAGSKLFFFEVGTTTPKTTFSDEAETVPNTDPVIADARGRFIPIFLSGTYDVELQDANGVQIWKALEISSSGVVGNVVFLGGFDSSTNAGNYPATGSKGDLFVVTTGFTLNPTSGSHVLSTRDFIIANTDAATGVDADWDIIRGVNAARTADIVVTVWDPGRAYAIGDYVKATDNKQYRALVAQTGNDPAGGGDPTNWLPFGDLLNILTSTDTTRGLTAAQGKILKDLIDDPVKATTLIQGVKFLPKRIILANSGIDVDHDMVFNFGTFNFNSGNGNGSLAFIVKQVDNTWVAGSNAGGLADALTVTANTWYHCFALSNSDGSSTDAGFDTAINAANLLADSNVIAAGLTEFRRQGSRKTDSSSNWIPAFQLGKKVRLLARIQELDTTNPADNTSGVLLILQNAPLGIRTDVILIIGYTTVSSQNMLITSPEETDIAASDTINTVHSVSADREMVEIEVITDLFSQIRHRSTNVNATRFQIQSLGWIDRTLEN